MKCHYEILEVEQEATEEDIKKSYRRLALKWHPDKNLNNADEAKEKFQLIQQAYEVLSDPQERSWYDRHRDSILKGGLSDDYQDDSLNVYAYFTTSCYKGYNDDENGFYSVYNEVFKTIGAEDSEFVSDDIEIPEFGTSTSPYVEIVHVFYAYWQSYSTKKSYAWLDEYDIRTAPNRRVVRLMEKENKKIRDKAKKERNEEVRALVNFVRKRDKRVQEYSKILEQKSLENDKKAQELRKKRILEKKEEMESYVESDWAKFSNVMEQLKDIESQFTDEDNEEEEEEESLYCSACNKIFKTPKAFHNHEKSKKHKDNVKMLEEDDDIPVDDEYFQSEEELEVEKIEIIESGSSVHVEDSESEEEIKIEKSKKKKDKKKKLIVESESSDIEIPLEEIEKRRSTKKQDLPKDPPKPKKKVKEKKKLEEKIEPQTVPDDEPKQHICQMCKIEFESKNALFKHLRTTGHAIFLSEKTNNDRKPAKGNRKK